MEKIQRRHKEWQCVLGNVWLPQSPWEVTKRLIWLIQTIQTPKWWFNELNNLIRFSTVYKCSVYKQLISSTFTITAFGRCPYQEWLTFIYFIQLSNWEFKGDRERGGTRKDQSWKSNTGRWLLNSPYTFFPKNTWYKETLFVNGILK